MAKNLVYLGVIVLAVIAVVLGYKIYQQRQVYQKPITPNQMASPPSVIKQIIPLSDIKPTPVAINISEDRKKIAIYPGPNAPEDQKQELGRIIERNVQDTDTLDITVCETYPLVIRVKKGSDLKLVNNDSVVRSIMFGPPNQYDVPTNSTRTINVSLNTGINLYRCNLVGNPIVGVVLVT